MNPEEQSYVDDLKDKNQDEAVQISCIDVLEVLLSIDALPVLVEILEDPVRSLSLRRRAAMAIREIGAETVKNDLVRLSKSTDKTTRDLAHLADN